MSETSKLSLVRPVAWAMRAPGCDGSADWAELGEDEPEPCSPMVASPLYDRAALDAAVDAAIARFRSENEMLLARVAELEEKSAQDFADAERYRWIRQGKEYVFKCGGAIFYCGGHLPQEGVNKSTYPENFDAGIDGAMRACDMLANGMPLDGSR